MPRILFLLCIALAAIALPSAEARKSKDLPSDASVDRTSWPDFRAYIEKEVRSGDSLAEMSPEDRAEVGAILDRMGRLMDGVDDVSELHNDDRIKLFNEQDRLRVLLTQAESDSRMECRREKVTGSNMPRSICRTVAEWRRYREQGQEFVRRHNMGPGLPRENLPAGPGGGGRNTP